MIEFFSNNLFNLYLQYIHLVSPDCMETAFGNSDWLWNEAEELVNISFNKIID